jgi:hypothetical protein
VSSRKSRRDTHLCTGKSSTSPRGSDLRHRRDIRPCSIVTIGSTEHTLARWPCRGQPPRLPCTTGCCIVDTTRRSPCTAWPRSLPDPESSHGTDAGPETHWQTDVALCFFDRVLAQIVDRLINVTVRTILSAILLVAAGAKLVDPTEFLEFLDLLVASNLSTRHGLFVVTVVLEVVVGLSILASGRGWPCLAAAVFFLSFAAVLAYAVVLAADVSCGCFGGALTERPSHASVARNMMLGGAALLLGLRSQSKQSSTRGRDVQRPRRSC